MTVKNRQRSKKILQPEGFKTNKSKVGGWGVEEHGGEYDAQVLSQLHHRSTVYSLSEKNTATPWVLHFNAEYWSVR